MTTDPQPSAPRRRVWLRVLFALSLAFNLLIVGLAIGAMARFDRPGGPPPVGAALYRAMPDQAREAMRDVFRAPRDEDRGDRRRAEIEAVVDALRAEPFDPDRLAGVVAGHLEYRHAHMARVQAAWIDRVAGMSPDERAEYADRLAGMKDGRKRRDWWHRRDER